MADALPAPGAALIRDIRDSDIDAIVAIYNHYIEHTVVSYEEKIITARDMAGRVNKVLDGGYPWLVAEVGGEVLGYCYAYQWSPRAAYRHTAEITVYLDPGAIGRGLGSRLYRALFAVLKNRDVRTVIGGIGFPNPASIALHEKMGLKKVAHFENVGYKFGRWLDVGYWQGDLEEMQDRDY